MSTNEHLQTIRAQSGVLIRAEAQSIEQRDRLEQSVRNAMLRKGCDINEVSEASGLTPKEIRRVLDLLPDASTGAERVAELV